jgi:hypothetical protein
MLIAEGSLGIPGKEGKTHDVSIGIEGELDFLEDTHPQGGDGEGKSLRYYRTAVGKITVDKQVDRLILSENRHLIAVHCTESGVELTSPLGPLTRSDLELLEMQFDPAVVTRLIPGDGVSKRDSWGIPPATAALLFGIDSADSSTLRGAAKAVDSAVVQIRIWGEVTGVADGAKTKIVVTESSLLFDRKEGQFSEVQINFSEVREPSPTAPGFDLKSRLNSHTAVVKNPEELSAQRLREVAPHWAPARPSTSQLDFSSIANEIGLVHDRSWHITAHRRELVVLRKMIGEKQIAQCNITRLPPASEDKTLDVKQFQEQVQKALGDNFGRVEEASQANDGDMEILRIVASGQANEVPITWIYFHLANQDGRRAAIVFTLATADVERFATSDHDLIGGFRFLEARTSEEQAERPSTEETQRE